MADQELWRKNIPEDFQGKMGENWDDEIHMKGIYWSTVGIAGSVAFAFGLCWIMMGPVLDYIPQKMGFTVEMSPLDEANARRLPPTPWLQPKPEVEMDDLLEEMAEHNSTYGWNDQLNGIVRIPVDRAMDLVAERFESAPATVEPAVDEPVDVEQPAEEAAAPVEDEPAASESGSEVQGSEAPRGSEAQGEQGEAHG